MKEQFVPGLASKYVTFPAEANDSSVVLHLEENTANDTAVPMSNLELLGDVAFAMSHPSGTGDCTGQPVVLSTDSGGVALEENDGQVPGSRVIYVLPTTGDDPCHNFAALLQPMIVPLAAAECDNMGDDNCVQSISDITNAPALYFTTLPQSYDTSCSVGPTQYTVCNAVTTTDDCDDNMASSHAEDKLAGYEHAAASADVVSVPSSCLISGVDMSLDSFSLSMLTDAMTS